MKKGLLTVLLASLVLVGCQNYDDQFDDLNAQISALKSQVDGLSALSGQVSALSGSISGLQSGIAASASSAQMTALSASLTALQAEVDAIEAAIATTATAAEVAALQTSLTAVETDLADLLTSNNVYASPIEVTTAASMASALALGNKVALMNANVTITDNATISDTDIQTFIDRIKTMNGTFKYDSGSATGFAPNFDEMVAGTVFDIKMAGPISAKKLASATTMTISTTYSTKITSLDLSALTSVTTISSGTDGSEVANTVTLASATNVDLGALPRYGSALSITTKKGATLDIAALDDVGTTGLIDPITLTLNGPDSVTLSKISDGTIALSNIGTATVSGFYGILDINAGVETLTTTDSVFIELDGAADLVTATLDFKYDWDPALTTANAAISAAGYSATYLEDYSAATSIQAADLKTLTVTGDLLDLHLNEANLETLSINANMTDLTMATLTDLTTLTVAGGKIGSISLTDSPNLTVANFDHTSNMENKGSATANKSVNFTVTNNLALTKLHTTGDLIKNFTVTGNDALTELDMTGLKTRGTDATGATVYLYDNDLTAVKSTDTTDAETATATTGADGGSADVGTTDDGTSGMDTMKIYLTAIAADALSTAQVNFDTVSTFDDSETTTTSTTLNVTGTTSVAAANDATVLKMTPASANTAAGAKAAIARKRGFLTAAGTTIVLFNTPSETATIPAGTGEGATANRGYTLTGNNAVDAAAIASQANKDIATALGMTLNAYNKGNSGAQVSLIAHEQTADGSNADALGERYTSTALSGTDARGTDGKQLWSAGLTDNITLTVGSNSVTTSLSSSLSAVGLQEYGGTVTTLAGIEAAIKSAWGAKYGPLSGTHSASAIATLVGLNNGIIEVVMLQTDSGGHDVAVSMSYNGAAGSATDSATGAGIDWVIGGTNTTGDNATTATTTAGIGLIITLESNSNAVDNVNAVVDASVGATMTEFSTDYTTNTAWAKAGLGTGPVVERTDVRQTEALVDAAASNAVAATKFNRVTWLG